MPTPVLSPWNNGSGFGPKDKEPKRTLDSFLRPSVATAGAAPGRHPSRRAGGQQGPGHRLDHRRAGRRRQGPGRPGVPQSLPEELLPWIDATVVLTGQDDQSFPPLLGTGGNDGRLDFSTNFHQRLLDVLRRAVGQADVLAWARDLLAGTETEPLAEAAVGQFDPAAAGGPGSSPFGAATSLVNPWGYVLLVEGALLFAASAARRQHYRPGAEPGGHALHGLRRPQTGSASGAAGEESRGEVWVPVWAQPFTLPEIRQLFAEARASWRGRPARRAVDFYAATRTLGVARGIGEFIRYGLQRRNGLAFAAVPLDKITVREKPEVRLAADVEDWASRVGGSDASSVIAEASRRFEKTHLEYARDGGALRLARMLAALTTLEQAVGRSGRTRDKTLVRRPPRAQGFLDVFVAADASPALRIAVGIASCATLPGIGHEPARSMRQILLPIDPPGPSERNRSGGWRDAAVVPGFGLRPVWQVLADVLIWRSHTAATEHDPRQKFRGVPTFRSGIPVLASDLHAWARDLIDETSLDLWLRACLALDWRGVRHDWPADRLMVPVPTLGLLHPLAQGLERQHADPGDLEPRLGLRPDWALRLAAGQVREVHEEAVARLSQAGWRAVPAPPAATVGQGARIAAALVPRCRGAAAVLRKFASPIEQPDERTTSDSSQTSDHEESQ